MAKKVFMNADSRNGLKVGIDALANAVKVTLGPKGRNVVIEKPGLSPTITKDGVSVAKEIVLEDPIANAFNLAFADRDKKGYSWNNMMLQRWTDHNGEEHRVLDDYERNCTLIDLNAQPDAVKATVDAAIREQLSHKDVGMVGAHFMKFCGKYELTKLSDQADTISRWLNETYKGVLNDTRQTSS